MSKPVRGKTIKIICACGCGRKKMVKITDIKRGWGKYFSKSCKAIDQEKRTGQFATYKNRNQKTVNGIPIDDNYLGITDQEHEEIMTDSERGWDSHKIW